MHRGFAIAPAPLMGAHLIVVLDPSVQIRLQSLDGGVDLLAEGNPIELVEHGAVEALTDAVGLRALGLGAGMVDILNGQVELVLVLMSMNYGPLC